VKSTVLPGKASDDSKFKDYFEYQRAARDDPVASHAGHSSRRGGRRAAVARGGAGRGDHRTPHPRDPEGRRAAQQLTLVATDAYKRILAPPSKSSCAWSSRRAPTTRRSRSSVAISSSCSLPRRPASARGGTRPGLPHRVSRSPWSVPPAPWCTPTRCTCIRKTASPAPFARWRPGSPRAHRHRQRDGEPRNGDAGQGGAARTRCTARRRSSW
jgi:hypothetical protein